MNTSRKRQERDLSVIMKLTAELETITVFYKLVYGHRFPGSPYSQDVRIDIVWLLELQ